MSEEPETKELVFAATKEYLRFGEFCDACRKYRYVGICHGVPGAGKTRSAREYASWNLLSPLFPEELFTLVGRRHLDDQFPHKPFATPTLLLSRRCSPVGRCIIQPRWPPPPRASSER